MQPGWVAPVTSGLAIASLVLSILWLGGLGSILAVVFGIIALSQIKQAQGRKTGSGLAIAGLIVGGIGILGSIGFYIAVVTLRDSVVNLLSTTTLQLGQTGSYSASDNSGISAITVESVTYPITSNDKLNQPAPGDEFAVALVKECAGPAGAPNGPDSADFELNFSAMVPVLPSPDAKSPGLDTFNAVAANSCATGYITFEIAKGSAPSSIEYAGGFFHSYRWALK